MKRSQFFRAFVAGATISDGRTITPEMINDIVTTFNAETYSPRINIEHIAGYSPEPPFNGYGTVVAVKAQDDTFTIAGKEETRKALYVQVDANDGLVGLADKDQKPFPSVELTDSYASTGKVGLVGLAFTDTPASIGTQRLKFSRSAPGTLFAHSDEAVSLAFAASPASPTEAAEFSLFKRFLATFSKSQEPAVVTPPAVAVPTAAPTISAEFNAQVLQGFQMSAAAMEAISTQLAKFTPLLALSDKVSAIEAGLAGEDRSSFRRAPATGGSNQHLAEF